MKNSYTKQLLHRFYIIFSLITVMIVMVVNLQYITIVKSGANSYAQDIDKYKLYKNQTQLKNQKELISAPEIIFNSFLNKAIPIYPTVENKQYSMSYTPPYNYWMFIIKPTLLIIFILSIIYFFMRTLLQKGLNNLAKLQSLLHQFLDKESFNKALYQDLFQEDEEISQIASELHELFLKNISISASRKRFIKKFELLNELVFEFDEKLVITEANAVFLKLHCKGENFSELLIQENRSNFFEHRQSLQNGNCEQLTLIDSLGALNTFYEIKIFFDGTTYGAVARDVTASHKEHKRVLHTSLHDTLTGLPNRALFIDRLTKEIATASREKRGFHLLFFDLNKFKEINDTYSHDIGDNILKTFALRVSMSLRDSDTFARFGGDEFLAILPDCSDIEHVIKKIHTSLETPYIHDDINILITTAIGLASYPQDATTPEMLIDFADKAMYLSKQKKRAYYTYTQTCDN